MSEFNASTIENEDINTSNTNLNSQDINNEYNSPYIFIHENNLNVQMNDKEITDHLSYKINNDDIIESSNPIANPKTYCNQLNIDLQIFHSKESVIYQTNNLLNYHSHFNNTNPNSEDTLKNSVNIIENIKDNLNKLSTVSQVNNSIIIENDNFIGKLNVESSNCMSHSLAELNCTSDYIPDRNNFRYNYNDNDDDINDDYDVEDTLNIKDNIASNDSYNYDQDLSSSDSSILVCNIETEDLSSDEDIKVSKFVPCTKGEYTLNDLPLIENLSLEVPEDVQLIKFGSIMSIVDVLVVIHCDAMQPALDIDSILFLDGRIPLGQIFETFGPVKSPWYSVRFNSADEIKKNTSIKLNASIHYAPQMSQWTRFVFIEELRRMKGSDASWKDNNEPPIAVIDYSDDEQERMVKKSRKRGQHHHSGDRTDDDNNIKNMNYNQSWPPNDREIFRPSKCAENNLTDKAATKKKKTRKSRRKQNQLNGVSQQRQSTVRGMRVDFNQTQNTVNTYKRQNNSKNYPTDCGSNNLYSNVVVGRIHNWENGAQLSRLDGSVTTSNGSTTTLIRENKIVGDNRSLLNPATSYRPSIRGRIIASRSHIGNSNTQKGNSPNNLNNSAPSFFRHARHVMVNTQTSNSVGNYRDSGRVVSRGNDANVIRSPNISRSYFNPSHSFVTPGAGQQTSDYGSAVGGVITAYNSLNPAVMATLR